MQKKINCLISILLSVSLIINPLSIQAKVLNKAKYEKMKKELSTLTYLLADVVEDKVNTHLDSIKQEVIEGGYDYELTMEAMREGDPYAGLDYVSVIAAYMASKQYYRDNNRGSFPGIMSLPIINCSTSVSSANVVKPVVIDSYEEAGDGLYRKKGKIYAVSQTKAYKYEEVKDGLYKRTGELKIEPREEEISYLAVSFTPMTDKEVFERFDIPEEEVEKAYAEIKDTLLSEITSEELRQSMWAKTPPVSIPALIEEFDDGTYDNISLIRKIVCLNAMSLQGMVPYEWGGKASHGGYDETWWTFKEGGKQKGLDCSGFVQWDFMTSGIPEPVWGDMYSTRQMLSSPMKNIAYEDLKPGDIGVKIGAVYNHTGIYMGKKNGRDMWAHCSSARNSVTIGEYDFHVYYDPYSPESGRWDDVLNSFLTEYRIDDWYDEDVFTALYDEAHPDEDLPLMDEIDDYLSIDGWEVPEGYEFDGHEDVIQGDDTESGFGISPPGGTIPGAETEEDYTGDDTDEADEESLCFESGTALPRHVREFRENIWENFLEKFMSLSVDNLVLWYKMQNTVSNNFSESDVYLLAQLIVHEAGSEGLNGWIGVAEVVRNRVISPLFPNTITEVIYQDGQFEDSESLSGITPSPDIQNIALAVLEGRAGILGNTDCLYFRNPRYAGLTAQDAVDWGSHAYYTGIGHHAFYLQGKAQEEGALQLQ